MFCTVFAHLIFNVLVHNSVTTSRAGFHIEHNSRNNSSNELKPHLKLLQENLNISIESSKQKYYSRIANRINNTQKNSRSYWSLMKIFLNNKKNTNYTSFILRESFHNKLQGKGRTFQLFLLQTMFPFGQSQLTSN